MPAINPPDLSIIVPVLNESACIAPLFETLAAQRDCRFELIFCDAGSRDDTQACICELGGRHDFPVRLVTAPRGRGRQMNAGADIAQGEFFLFLHADSRFLHPRALQTALDHLRQEIEDSGTDAVAAHFALRFDRGMQKESFGYFFYECKARLPRRGCIHGDQGFVLPRSFFIRIGGFDEQLPFLEDEKLAETIFDNGRWLLVPAEIETSIRRFEREGLQERQTLNALILNFYHIGWQDFLTETPGIYRNQAQLERLDLAPFFELIQVLLRSYSAPRRRQLWFETGAYVRSQAWQVPYMLRIRLHYCRAKPQAACWAEPGRWQWLFDRLTDHLLGNWISALLVRTWFMVSARGFEKKSADKV